MEFRYFLELVFSEMLMPALEWDVYIYFVIFRGFTKIDSGR
jgi:hypothetical protein